MSPLKLIPPHPNVILKLRKKYLKKKKKFPDLSFRNYLIDIGFRDRAKSMEGDDDNQPNIKRASDRKKINIPRVKINDRIPIKVLLVDFKDRRGKMSKKFYEEILFSKSIVPANSLKEYYQEVSLGKVEICGTVHGWFRMPEKYSYYIGKDSGMDGDSYPNNSQKLVEEAVTIAIDKGTTFEQDLDILNNGKVGSLMIVHSGKEAAYLDSPGNLKHIIAHWGQIRNKIKCPPFNLNIDCFIIVSQKPDLGTLAHEFGHLAFQWDDFYDTDYSQTDPHKWAGSGYWDLMGNGCFVHNLSHPAGLHKSQHEWIKVDIVSRPQSPQKYVLFPYSKSSGNILKIISPKFKDGQFIIIENRNKLGFDSDLPGEGLLVWKVDLNGHVMSPINPALLLVQADGYLDLETDYNWGDPGDPFPGDQNVNSLGDTGTISTSFASMNSGIFLSDIYRNPTSGEISFKVEMKQ